MAKFVVAVGITPDQYRALTLGERDAIMRAYNAHHRKT